MAEDNTKIGTTITYDSQHALDAARKYKEQIAAQLGHKLASRPYTPAEQRRNVIGTKLLDATQGKASLPQNIAAAYPAGSAPSTGTTTDSFLKDRTIPVNMSSSLNDDSFIRGAYQTLLGRDADDTGLAHWKNDLAGGASRKDVVSNMKRSPEYGRRQQDQMRDLITPKDPTQVLNEAYDDQIATYGRAYQTAQDAVQKDFGTAQDYSPLLTTNQSIYTQDPEASQLASVNYLATQDPSDSSPSIWTQALKDAGAEAIKGINIPGLVSGFFNSKKACIA